MVHIRDYEKDKEVLRKIILDPKYTDDLISIALRKTVAFRVDLNDVEKEDAVLCEAILNNTKRFVKVISAVIDEVLPDFRSGTVEHKDTFDVFIEHRIHAEQRRREESGLPNDNTFISKYPPELMRRYELYLDPPTYHAPLSVRQVKAKHIGKFVTVTGIVTRCTDVKPKVIVATYTCDSCSAETYQPIGSNSFMPLERCQSEECKGNRVTGRLTMQMRGSKFTKFQELRIQEHSHDVPIGHIPVSLKVLCHGETTRLALPGASVRISGIYLPEAKHNRFKVSESLLLATPYLEAHSITVTTIADDEEDDGMNDAEFSQYIVDKNFTLDQLAMSIAPEIFGHLDLKKALLLQLVGGVDVKRKGMKIRGSIHICMMGDPGVAKSQLLGFIDRLAPRCQYTTGRGSTGVGLTAAVIKDQTTGEFVLEGGALVLADQGTCCIDEFDKMMESDRTAIHEVMEQETISIAKAGIMTTLNARVSILAAANPIFGRYNRKKSIEQNIQLPAALLSRFDLLWLITDQPDRENDLKLAQHITYVHQHSEQPPLQFEPLPIKTIRRYIRLAKAKTPVVPEHLSKDIVDAYVQMRADARNNARDSTFTSARTLLAILRLATSLAKCRLASVVEPSDIHEAIRLIDCSKASITKHEDHNPVVSINEKILQCIKTIAANNKSKEVDMGDAVEQCINRGFTNDNIEEAIEEYEMVNMLHVNSSRTKIIIV